MTDHKAPAISIMITIDASFILLLPILGTVDLLPEQRVTGKTDKLNNHA
jgi:hypothetical protein